MPADAIPEGVHPYVGAWLVSPGRKLAYGQITRVRKDAVEWRSSHGHLVRTSHELINNGDYVYLPAGPLPGGYTRMERK